MPETSLRGEGKQRIRSETSPKSITIKTSKKQRYRKSNEVEIQKVARLEAERVQNDPGRKGPRAKKCSLPKLDFFSDNDKAKIVIAQRQSIDCNKTHENNQDECRDIEQERK